MYFNFSVYLGKVSVLVSLVMICTFISLVKLSTIFKVNLIRENTRDFIFLEISHFFFQTFSQIFNIVSLKYKYIYWHYNLLSSVCYTMVVLTYEMQSWEEMFVIDFC